MFEKEAKDRKYKENPYRSVNFEQDEGRNLICLIIGNSISDILRLFEGTNMAGWKKSMNVKNVHIKKNVVNVQKTIERFG